LEGEATSRAIRLAKFVNTPLYVVHVMSIDAMEEIAKAKREGLMLDHLVQTSSSHANKQELFYEHLVSEHWLVSTL
jgi:dihydroorotase-like cyclic amidohydrolase